MCQRSRAHIDSCAHIDSNPRADLHACTHTDSNAYTGPYPNSDSCADTDPYPNINTDAYTDAVGCSPDPRRILVELRPGR